MTPTTFLFFDSRREGIDFYYRLKGGNLFLCASSIHQVHQDKQNIHREAKNITIIAVLSEVLASKDKTIYNSLEATRF
jgi:hypothetical protein